MRSQWVPGPLPQKKGEAICTHDLRSRSALTIYAHDTHSRSTLTICTHDLCSQNALTICAHDLRSRYALTIYTHCILYCMQLQYVSCHKLQQWTRGSIQLWGLVCYLSMSLNAAVEQQIQLWNRLSSNIMDYIVE